MESQFLPPLQRGKSMQGWTKDEFESTCRLFAFRNRVSLCPVLSVAILEFTV